MIFLGHASVSCSMLGFPIDVGYVIGSVCVLIGGAVGDEWIISFFKNLYSVFNIIRGKKMLIIQIYFYIKQVPILFLSRLMKIILKYASFSFQQFDWNTMPRFTTTFCTRSSTTTLRGTLHRPQPTTDLVENKNLYRTSCSNILEASGLNTLIDNRIDKPIEIIGRSKDRKRIGGDQIVKL